jgi:hypothetical protein
MRGVLIDLKDQEIEKWTVLEYVGGPKSKWRCRCICGRIVDVRGENLRNRSSKQCVSCNGRKYTGQISGWMFNRIKNRARKDNLEFDLTKEYMWDIFENQQGKCAISGVSIGFADSAREQWSGKTTASLDRKDSSSGYIVDNVQWVHKHINMMKQNHTDEYFIKMCTIVADYNNKKYQG